MDDDDDGDDDDGDDDDGDDDDGDDGDDDDGDDDDGDDDDDDDGDDGDDDDGDDGDDDGAKQTNQIEVMQDCCSSCVTNRWHHDAFVVFVNLEFLLESTSFRHRRVDARTLVIVLDTTKNGCPVKEWKNIVIIN